MSDVMLFGAIEAHSKVPQLEINLGSDYQSDEAIRDAAAQGDVGEGGWPCIGTNRCCNGRNDGVAITTQRRVRFCGDYNLHKTQQDIDT